MCTKEELEKMIMTDTAGFVKKRYEDLFLSVYTRDDFELVKAAADAVVTNAGMILKKSI